MHNTKRTTYIALLLSALMLLCPLATQAGALDAEAIAAGGLVLVPQAATIPAEYLPLSLSPEGDRALLASEDGVSVLNLDDGTMVPLLPDMEVPVSRRMFEFSWVQVSWSPDGQYASIARRETDTEQADLNQLLLVDLTNMTLGTIARSQGDLGRAVFDPNQPAVLFYEEYNAPPFLLGTQRRTLVYRLDLTTDHRSLTESIALSGEAYTQDASFFDNQEGCIVSTNAGKVRRLGNWLYATVVQKIEPTLMTLEPGHTPKLLALPMWDSVTLGDVADGYAALIAFPGIPGAASGVYLMPLALMPEGVAESASPMEMFTVLSMEETRDPEDLGLLPLEMPDVKGIAALTFSPDGQELAVLCSGGVSTLLYGGEDALYLADVALGVYSKVDISALLPAEGEAVATLEHEPVREPAIQWAGDRLLITLGGRTGIFTLGQAAAGGAQ